MSEKKNCGCGQDPCVTYGAEPELVGGPCEICGEDLFRDYDDSMGDVCLSCYYEERSKQDDEGTEYDGWLVNFAESFGAESLMAINQNTPISNFTTNELTHSSTVQGDFNQASINSSGHQNFEVRGAEDMSGRVVNVVGGGDKVYVTIRFPDSDKIFVGDMEDVMLAESFGAESFDTEKYEGHTRGPWRYYDDEEHDCWVFEGEDIEAQARVAFFAFTPCEGIAYLDDPDLNLMIDAPLLLAEVKELQAWKAEVERICRTMNGPNRDTALFLMTNEAKLNAESFDAEMKDSHLTVSQRVLRAVHDQYPALYEDIEEGTQFPPEELEDTGDYDDAVDIAETMQLVRLLSADIRNTSEPIKEFYDITTTYPRGVENEMYAESFGAEDLAYCPRCGLNPNDNQPEEQQKWESDHVKEYGVCNYCMEELIDEGGEEVALQFDEGTFSFNGESFGAEYGKRQRFGNRYVARDTKGRIISNVSVGRSLKADRRTKSKTPARSGFGHKGDSQKGASGEFKMPTDAKSLIGIGAVLGGLLAYLESKA